MARTKAELSRGARLSDYLSASLLARVYPMPLVNDVLHEHGCNSQRVRLFPASAGVYYCMAQQPGHPQLADECRPAIAAIESAALQDTHNFPH